MVEQEILKNRWRKVPGYDKYEILINEKECKCRSLNYRRTGKVRELSNRGQRIFWCLANEEGPRYEQAAVWVALTYPELVENEYFKGAVIDHIDTNPLNNHPSNLRWTTTRGNANNPITRENKINAAKTTKVKQLSLNGEVMQTYKSVIEAERRTKIDNGNISKCCQGKRNTAGGFKWMYE